MPSSPEVGAFLFAVVLVLLFLRALRNYALLPLLPAPARRDPPPDCMVVIPARDEQDVIARAIRSFPPDTVIVVDDASRDRTAEQARQAGAGVLPAPAVSQGALGKANACMAGARVLTSRWILFADADTWFRDGLLESAADYAEANGLALLSIHLEPAPSGFWGNVLEPYLTALRFCGASPRRDPTGVFQGPCVLALREGYEFLGGHWVVRRYPAEATHLAYLARQHRMKFATVRAQDLGYVQSIRGWTGAWRGFERWTFRWMQCGTSISLMILWTAVAAALWFPVLVWTIYGGHRAVGAAIAVLPVLLLGPWYGRSLTGWFRAFLAPLAIYVALPMLIFGFVKSVVGRRMRWKGRTVRVA